MTEKNSLSLIHHKITRNKQITLIKQDPCNLRRIEIRREMKIGRGIGGGRGRERTRKRERKKEKEAERGRA